MREIKTLAPRQREILTSVVRSFITTGEPVGSRTVSRQRHAALSPATIRNVMADLEAAGYLHQPHTSAGRVPTPKAYRLYAEEMRARARLSRQDEELIDLNLSGQAGAETIMERSSHALSVVSHNLAIVISPPLEQVVLEHVRFLRLPDGRILVVLVARGNQVQHKTIRLRQEFSQAELDQIGNYLSQEFYAWTLQAVRRELQRRIEEERAEYGRLLRQAMMLCEVGLIEPDRLPDVYVDGAANLVAKPEFADQHKLEELLRAVEEKEKLVRFLTDCIESPGPEIHILIGLEDLAPAMKQFALVSAPYRLEGRIVGSVGVLGPSRMEYGRAISAVSYVANRMTQMLTES